MLEKFLTMSSDDFKLLLHSSGSSETEKKVEAYRYSKVRIFYSSITLSYDLIYM